MINPKELRIGNWVLDADEEFYEIIYADAIHHGLSYDPIIITPEILEKCGFGNFDFGENFSAKMHDGVLFIEQYSEGAEALPHIKYLHQLQNLYYALTGKELEVKF